MPGFFKMIAFYKVYACNNGMVKVRESMWLWQINDGYSSIRQLIHKVRARERSRIWFIKNKHHVQFLHERCQTRTSTTATSTLLYSTLRELCRCTGFCLPHLIQYIHRFLWIFCVLIHNLKRGLKAELPVTSNRCMERKANTLNDICVQALHTHYENGF